MSYAKTPAGANAALLCAPALAVVAACAASGDSVHEELAGEPLVEAPHDETPADPAAEPARAEHAAAEALAATLELGSGYDKPGFVTCIDDGRLWVFRDGADELADFVAHGELVKCVTRPGGGPGGITVKAPDSETIAAFVAARPGFVTELVDGRIWVFHEGAEELADFRAHGELAKHVIRPGAGPDGMTIKAPDTDTVAAYVAARPGFVTIAVDGRVWVFETDSEELADFRARGELAKHVIRPGAGPDGVTLKAPDVATITAYLAACEGFETFVVDGRVWVFRVGVPALAEFHAHGEPAQSVTRPGAGPGGVTLRGPDAETLDAYSRAVDA